MGATGGKLRGRLVVTAVAIAGVVSLGSSAASAQTVGGCPTVNGIDFYEDGAFNTDAYLSVLRAQAACEEGDPTLPTTGTSSADYAVVGVGLVVVGAAAVVASRRRRTSED